MTGNVHVTLQRIHIIFIPPWLSQQPDTISNRALFMVTSRQKQQSSVLKWSNILTKLEFS
jgi:hypothetical protein